MSSDEVYEYLVGKFSSLLQEPGADGLACGKQFRSLEKFLKSNYIEAEERQDIRRKLYELTDLLNECRFYAQRRRFAAKKGRFHLNSLWEPIFTLKAKRALKRMEVALTSDTNSSLRLKSEERYFEATHDAELWDTSVGLGLDSWPEKLEELLSDDDCGRDIDGVDRLMGIGVVGLQGSGKTAVVGKVFGSSRVREKYSPCIWVNLSETLHDEPVKSELRAEILKQMLRQLPDFDAAELENDKHSVADLLGRLQLQLLYKKYLIVFDQLWHASDWFLGLGGTVNEQRAFGSNLADRMWYFLPKTGGGRIIVTTTRECVVRNVVGCKHLFRIQPQLNMNACWSIVKDVAAGDGRVTEEDQNEIIKKCHGLPFAAKILAEVIPGQVSQ